MPCFEKTSLYRITDANYVTSVNGMLHPDRVMQEYDFLYILDGFWEIYETDTAYPMQTDDLLILTPGLRHYGKNPCNPGNRHMYIHVLPSRTRMDNPENTLLSPTLVHCQKNPKIRQGFHEIITARWTPGPEQQNRLSLLFSLLLCEISELLSMPVQHPAPDPVVEQACERVRTTPQLFFTASQMAASFFLCERTLNNRFQKTLGKTFYAFQMETKLEMVRRFLLTQPQAKLHEAALNYGFYDEFHLSKAFKKQFGISPSEYRKSHPCP